MSATDVLRRLLDEQGVEHKDFFDQTWWEDSDGAAYIAVETRPLDNNNPSTKLMLKRTATPEQAIAATLGAGTCRMELPDLRGLAFTDVYVCSECGGEVMVGTVMGESDVPKWCPWCGRKVVSE